MSPFEIALLVIVVVAFVFMGHSHLDLKKTVDDQATQLEQFRNEHDKAKTPVENSGAHRNDSTTTGLTAEQMRWWHANFDKVVRAFANGIMTWEDHKGYVSPAARLQALQQIRFDKNLMSLIDRMQQRILALGDKVDEMEEKRQKEIEAMEEKHKKYVDDRVGKLEGELKDMGEKVEATEVKVQTLENELKIVDNQVVAAEQRAKKAMDDVSAQTAKVQRLEDFIYDTHDVVKALKQREEALEGKVQDFRSCSCGKKQLIESGSESQECEDEEPREGEGRSRSDESKLRKGKGGAVRKTRGASRRTRFIDPQIMDEPAVDDDPWQDIDDDPTVTSDESSEFIDDPPGNNGNDSDSDHPGDDGGDSGGAAVSATGAPEPQVDIEQPHAEEPNEGPRSTNVPEHAPHVAAPFTARPLSGPDELKTALSAATEAIATHPFRSLADRTKMRSSNHPSIFEDTDSDADVSDSGDGNFDGAHKKAKVNVRELVGRLGAMSIKKIPPQQIEVIDLTGEEPAHSSQGRCPASGGTAQIPPVQKGDENAATGDNDPQNSPTAAVIPDVTVTSPTDSSVQASVEEAEDTGETTLASDVVRESSNPVAPYTIDDGVFESPDMSTEEYAAAFGVDSFVPAASAQAGEQVGTIGDAHDSLELAEQGVPPAETRAQVLPLLSTYDLDEEDIAMYREVAQGSPTEYLEQLKQIEDSLLPHRVLDGLPVPEGIDELDEARVRRAGIGPETAPTASEVVAEQEAEAIVSPASPPASESPNHDSVPPTPGAASPTQVSRTPPDEFESTLQLAVEQPEILESPTSPSASPPTPGSGSPPAEAAHGTQGAAATSQPPAQVPVGAGFDASRFAGLNANFSQRTGILGDDLHRQISSKPLVAQSPRAVDTPVDSSTAPPPPAQLPKGMGIDFTKQGSNFMGASKSSRAESSTASIRNGMFDLSHLVESKKVEQPTEQTPEGVPDAPTAEGQPPSNTQQPSSAQQSQQEQNESQTEDTPQQVQSPTAVENEPLPAQATPPIHAAQPSVGDTADPLPQPPQTSVVDSNPQPAQQPSARSTMTFSAGPAQQQSPLRHSSEARQADASELASRTTAQPRGRLRGGRTPTSATGPHNPMTFGVTPDMKFEGNPSQTPQVPSTSHQQSTAPAVALSNASLATLPPSTTNSGAGSKPVSFGQQQTAASSTNQNSGASASDPTAAPRSSQETISDTQQAQAQASDGNAVNQPLAIDTNVAQQESSTSSPFRPALSGEGQRIAPEGELANMLAASLFPGSQYTGGAVSSPVSFPSLGGSSSNKPAPISTAADLSTTPTTAPSSAGISGSKWAKPIYSPATAESEAPAPPPAFGGLSGSRFAHGPRAAASSAPVVEASPLLNSATGSLDASAQVSGAPAQPSFVQNPAPAPAPTPAPVNQPDDDAMEGVEQEPEGMEVDEQQPQQPAQDPAMSAFDTSNTIPPQVGFSGGGSQTFGGFGGNAQTVGASGSGNAVRGLNVAAPSFTPQWVQQIPGLFPPQPEQPIDNDDAMEDVDTAQNGLASGSEHNMTSGALQGQTGQQAWGQSFQHPVSQSAPAPTGAIPVANSDDIDMGLEDITDFADSIVQAEQQPPAQTALRPVSRPSTAASASESAQPTPAPQSTWSILNIYGQPAIAATDADERARVRSEAAAGANEFGTALDMIENGDAPVDLLDGIDVPAVGEIAWARVQAKRRAHQREAQPAVSQTDDPDVVYTEGGGRVGTGFDMPNGIRNDDDDFDREIYGDPETGNGNDAVEGDRTPEPGSPDSGGSVASGSWDLSPPQPARIRPEDVPYDPFDEERDDPENLDSDGYVLSSPKRSDTEESQASESTEQRHLPGLSPEEREAHDPRLLRGMRVETAEAGREYKYSELPLKLRLEVKKANKGVEPDSSFRYNNLGRRLLPVRKSKARETEAVQYDPESRTYDQLTPAEQKKYRQANIKPNGQTMTFATVGGEPWDDPDWVPDPNVRFDRDGNPIRRQIKKPKGKGNESPSANTGRSFADQTLQERRNNREANMTARSGEEEIESSEQPIHHEMPVRNIAAARSRLTGETHNPWGPAKEHNAKKEWEETKAKIEAAGSGPAFFAEGDDWRPESREEIEHKRRLAEGATQSQTAAAGDPSSRSGPLRPTNATNPRDLLNPFGRLTLMSSHAHAASSPTAPQLPGMSPTSPSVMPQSRLPTSPATMNGTMPTTGLPATAPTQAAPTAGTLIGGYRLDNTGTMRPVYPSLSTPSVNYSPTSPGGPLAPFYRPSPLGASAPYGPAHLNRTGMAPPAPRPGFISTSPYAPQIPMSAVNAVQAPNRSRGMAAIPEGDSDSSDEIDTEDEDMADSDKPVPPSSQHNPTVMRMELDASQPPIPPSAKQEPDALPFKFGGSILSNLGPYKQQFRPGVKHDEDTQFYHNPFKPAPIIPKVDIVDENGKKIWDFGQLHDEVKADEVSDEGEEFETVFSRDTTDGKR